MRVTLLLPSPAYLLKNQTLPHTHSVFRLSPSIHPTFSLSFLFTSMELHKANLEAQSQAAATAAAILSSSNNSTISNPAVAAVAAVSSTTTSSCSSQQNSTTTLSDAQQQNSFQLWAVQQQMKPYIAASPYHFPGKPHLQQQQHHQQQAMAAAVAAAAARGAYNPVAAASQHASDLQAALFGMNAGFTPTVTTASANSGFYHVTPKLKAASTSSGMFSMASSAPAQSSSTAGTNSHRGTDKFSPY